MTLILSGTDGLSDIDGSAATPAIRGTDTNTGIFFPAADTIAFSEGGTEAMRIDSSGNVGIGTSSPGGKLSVIGDGATFIARAATNNTLTSVQLQIVNSADTSVYRTIYYGASNTGGSVFNVGANGTAIFQEANAPLGIGTFNVAQPLIFGTNSVERARITSGGLFGVNGTPPSDSQFYSATSAAGTFAGTFSSSNASTGYGISIGTNSAFLVYFYPNAARSTAPVGSITHNGTNTAYNTSSDYRLKENIKPMTGALAKVAALKPCTYTWKVNGAEGEGFIAHELADICPGAVHGEKDAVNEDGSIKPQGIDTSFLVATLTAAIQEQQAIIQSLTARIEALEGK